MVEYAFLLVAVGVPAVAGLTAGGKTMYEGYKTRPQLDAEPVSRDREDVTA